MDTRCPANTLRRFLQVVSTVAYIVSSMKLGLMLWMSIGIEY
jgi:hypothetical protein